MAKIVKGPIETKTKPETIAKTCCEKRAQTMTEHNTLPVKCPDCGLIAGVRPAEQVVYGAVWPPCKYGLANRLECSSMKLAILDAQAAEIRTH